MVHATTVEGPIEGMEYPIVTFRRSTQSRGPHGDRDEFGTSGSLIVGSNERLYPWMDEGFNTSRSRCAANIFRHAVL